MLQNITFFSLQNCTSKIYHKKKSQPNVLYFIGWLGKIIYFLKISKILELKKLKIPKFEDFSNILVLQILSKKMLNQSKSYNNCVPLSVTKFLSSSNNLIHRSYNHFWIETIFIHKLDQ